MTRHDRIAEQLISGKIKMPSYYSKSDEGIQGYVSSLETKAKQYIKALDQGRVLCVVHSVSRSGMTRTMSFRACEKPSKHASRFQYNDYNDLFGAFSGSPLNKVGNVKVSGCGMDMVFETNYHLINNLQAFGFLTKKRASRLAQQTPQCIY